MSFFKKKTEVKQPIRFVAPVDGEVIALSEVPDPVFSQKMMGDGIAICASGNNVVAPADGTITLIAQTSHAFGMTLDNGIELMVHVGLETVSLNGQGFEVLAQMGDKVKKGTPILHVDCALMKDKGISLITPCIIINHQEHPIRDVHTSTHVRAGIDDILETL